MDQINLIAWTGRRAVEHGGLDARQAAMMHATLGRAGEAEPQHGDCLPALWHWAAFPPVAPMEELGLDGHPRPGGFLPPMPASRRMWAGGSLQFHAPLHVGETITRQSVIREVVEKDGAAGKMVFVTVDHRISGETGLAISEQQDIVYLPMPDRYQPPKTKALPEAPVLTDKVEASEVLLFRYSALTFNSHRIHYDQAYAQSVEHYPGLVVHGPLQATLLMAAAVAHKGRVPKDFHYRGVHPVFAGSVDVMATEEDGVLSLCTGQDGHQGMQATAIWEETL
ncbi:FAS1-like dehydratase domain-containing protein [Pacificoceanicola onchidii]|uniref:FAS1-like dehydratase domain-containing protein n=1 Tax=Pacificoceanicola onchidii TaxID=2562685 RepID=UPI001F0E425F|nr:MaoC family dehydratase N-terminal domain-containing protein [Pacificoceanicola onchidii]